MHIKIDENLFFTQSNIFDIEKSLFNFFIDCKENIITEYFNNKEINCFFLSKEVSKNSEEIILYENDILRPSKKSPIIDALYPTISYFIKNKNFTISEKLLKILGDVYFLRLFKNNYFDILAKEISEASFNRRLRMVEGSFLNCQNNFDLIDILNLLSENKSFKIFYPYSQVGDLKINENEYAECLGVSWNSDLLNLSLKIKINGNVDILEGFEKFNINNKYPSFIYRNIPIIKNNKLVIDNLKFNCDQETFNFLVKLSLIEDKDYSEKSTFNLNLKNLKKINKVDDFFNIDIFSEKIIDLNKKEAKLKVLKEKIIKNENNNIESELNLFLLSKGITKNGYIYKKENSEDKDFTDVTEFKSYLKGISSFPKTSEVVKKLSENKKLTPREKMIAEASESCTHLDFYLNSKEIFEDIDNTKKEIINLENYINKNKMHLLETDSWFKNLDFERKNIDYNYKDFTICIEISHKKITK